MGLISSDDMALPITTGIDTFSYNPDVAVPNNMVNLEKNITKEKKKINEKYCQYHIHVFNINAPFQ